ncbi:MAG TPA: GDP-mannose dehydrogenase [Rhodobacteraceae bacterium]|jgi:GDP-mannose 6-dehydrogenase|nr:GDP-mannose dehydrogenase [Paracoccaceae bacterium]
MNKIKSKNICVFGLGYVGCVGIACLAEAGHKVIGVDINTAKVELVNNGIPTIVEPGLDDLLKKGVECGRVTATSNVDLAVIDSEILFITVGTPCKLNGELDLSHIYSVAESIGKIISQIDEHLVIAIRSTVKPNTCKKVAEIIEIHSGKKCNKDFSVVANPEFLREGTAIQDYFNPPYVLIGASDKAGADEVASIYENVNAEIINVDIKTAEIIKYVNNSWHALKVTFGNEVGSICKALNIDSNEVMDIFCKDIILNISASYLRPGFAYGGACLPKDLSALVALSSEANVSTPLIDNICKSNEAHIERALKLIERYKVETNIGFLGVSFKAGTDDLRNSPTLKIIHALIEAGYNVRIYDDTVSFALSTGRNVGLLRDQLGDISKFLVESPKDFLDFAEVVIVAKNEPSFSVILNELIDRHVIDLVGLKEFKVKENTYTVLV